METENSSELTNDDRERIFMNEISHGATICAASAKAGIHRSTIYRWLKTDELFRGAVTEALELQSDSVDDRLTELSRKAVDILNDLMEQPDVPRELRFRAAVAVLAHLPRHAWHRHKLPAVLLPEEPEPEHNDDLDNLETHPHFHKRPWATKRH